MRVVCGFEVQEIPNASGIHAAFNPPLPKSPHHRLCLLPELKGHIAPCFTRVGDGTNLALLLKYRYACNSLAAICAITSSLFRADRVGTHLRGWRKRRLESSQATIPCSREPCRTVDYSSGILLSVQF